MTADREAAGGLRIVPVDPDDEELAGRWHATYLASERAGREQVAVPWHLPEVLAQVRQTSRARRTGLYAGLDGDRVAVAGYLGLPLLTNTDHAEVMVHTAPDRRRRGLGTAMLDHLTGVAREHGRSLLSTEAHWPYDGGPSGAGHDGPEFLAARGFRLGLGDVHRVLGVPVEERRLAELEAEAAPHHPAYTLRAWIGPVPEELLVSWARLWATLATEAPTGELELEPESTDPSVVREEEELVARQGRTKVNCVALDADGQVVAYTDIATTVHEPERAFQWGTLVHRDHRGHRLGLAVKVANLRQLQAEFPRVRSVVTYNAEVNEHMVGVNDLLGFRPVERLGEYQKHLAD